MPIILITDCDCDINDADGELTYQYQDRRTVLPQEYLSVDSERIFTEEFDSSFN